MNSNHSRPELWILGTPLHEGESLSPAAAKIIADSDLLIGESQAICRRRFGDRSPFYCLDNISAEDEKEIRQKIGTLSQKKGGRVVLISDGGMPILFDPGDWVLAECRRNGFTIRCRPEATSFGTAMAVSGYKPPFLVYGFLPRETEERKRAWKGITQVEQPVVLLETPYRYRKLLSEVIAEMPSAEVFVAWEIGNPDEGYLWTRASGLLSESERRNWKKGEFILILKSSEVM